MAKTNDNVKLVIGAIVFCIASSLGKIMYSEMKASNINRTSASTYDIDTDYQRYTVVTDKSNKVKIKVDDKQSTNSYQYSIDISDSTNKFKQTAKGLTAKHKDYQIKNKQLISQASTAYGFIISNDYKLIKYCNKYHPLPRLKVAFDSHFKEKKHKAETILNNAYGVSGAKDFEYALMSNPDVIKTFEQQIENDYQGVKAMAYQDGVKNFTRKQYCQMFDDNEAIAFAIDNDDKKFQAILPNF